MLHNNQDTTPTQEGTPTESEKITDTQEISSAVSDMLEDDFEGSHSNQKIIRDLAAQKEALIKEINEYSEKIEKLKAQYEEGYNIYQNLLKEANSNGDKEAVKDIEAQLNEVKKMMIKDMNDTRK